MKPQIKSTIKTSIKHESFKDSINYIHGLSEAYLINSDERDYWIEEIFKYHNL